MSYVAATAGITAEDVRDLMVAAVEHRFGAVSQMPSLIEWLTDNGSCYVARDTRRFARELGLIPKTTSLESPQSNGMAEASVRTLKRDYVRISVLPDAESVLRQLPIWLARYNDLHPHRALGHRSPRELIARSTNRLDALAITEADQPGHIERAHRPAYWMGQSRKKWLQPLIQIVSAR